MCAISSTSTNDLPDYVDLCVAGHENRDNLCTSQLFVVGKLESSLDNALSKQPEHYATNLMLSKIEQQEPFCHVAAGS